MAVDIDSYNLKGQSIRKKISYVYMVTILLLPFLNVAWYLPVEKSLEESVSESQLLVAENLELRTTLFLDGVSKSIASAARLIAINPNQVNIDETLSYLLETNPALLQLLYFDVQGAERVGLERFSQDPQKKFEHYEEYSHERNFINRALQGEYITSDVHLINKTIPIIDTYVPVIIDGEIKGVVKGIIDIQTLSGDFHEVDSKGMTAYLVDSQGFIMVHSDLSLIPGQVDAHNRQVVSQVLSGGKVDGLGEGVGYVNEVSEKMFVVGVPIENGWGIIVEIDEKIAFERIEFIRNIAILITLFMFPFALYVVMSGRRISKAQHNFKAALSEAQKLATIVEKSFEAIVIVDAVSNKYLYVNPSWERITGWSGEEVVGKESPNLLNSGKHSKEFFKNLWDTILVMETYEGEMINKKKDGTFYVSEVMIIPIKDKKGPVAYFAEISRDITERKKASDELIAQSNELERANKLMIGRELKMIELKQKITRLEEGSNEKT